MSIGMWEWVAIIIVTLIAIWVLGKKFKKDAPEVAKVAGKSINKFKEGLSGKK